MANPDSKDTFSIGNLINQFKDRARDVVRQANAALEPVREPLRALNQQTQKVADAAAHQVRQANRYIQEKQDQIHQNQRELGGKLQKSYQEFQAQWQRKDAPQAIRDSDGINVFKPVFDAAKATYEATAVHEVQEMVEDGRKAVEKKAGDAIGQGLKQANQSFRQGLKDAAPTLQALDRNIGQFDRDVHQALPNAPRLADVSHAIDEGRRRDRQAVHEFLMRKDVPAEFGQQLQSASRFMTAKGEHAKYYSDATGLTTTAGYVQDIDMLHSVGKGGLKMAEMVQKPESREALRTLLTRPAEHWENTKQAIARIPQDRALWDAHKAQELQEFQALRQPHAAPVPVAPETIARRIEEADRRVAEQGGKPHNLMDPAHVQTASEAAARDSALNSIRGGNPDGGERNCLAGVMATYDRHHGIPTSTFVNPGGAEQRAFLNSSLDTVKRDFQNQFHEVRGREDVLRHLENRETGLLWSRHPDGSERLLQVSKGGEKLIFRDPHGGGIVPSQEVQKMSGHKFMAAPLEERAARPIDLSILKTHFQSEWQQVHGLNELSSHLGKEGSSGVLWFSNNGQAHLINMANVDGHVVLMDSQWEKLVSPRSLPEIRVQADGSTNFQFMPTPPPRNYQGIPPHGSIETPQPRIGEPAGPPRHTLIGPDGQARPATDGEVRQAIRDATPRNRVTGTDGKVSLATDEEVRRGLQAAARPHVPEGGAPSAGGSAHPPQHPEPTTGSAGAYPQRPFGMRPQDQEIFAEAARREQRWIVVRETNPEALKYIGQPGYTPKPFECKAKSANVPEHKYAGLVVDPKRHPGAFQDPAAATAEWDKMLAQTKGDSRFAVDRSGRLRFEGKMVHSDYDIYDVIHPDRPVNLSPVGMQGGQPVFETRGLPPIRDYVNKQVGSDVIQHAGEAQFKGHSEQRLIVFGPNGERFVTDGKQAIEDVYKERFPGRYALEQSRPAPPDNVVQFPKLRAVETPPPDPLKTPISRDELWRQGVQNQRGFQSSPSGSADRLRKEPAKIEIDTQGVGPRVGKGFETFGAIQVLDKNGQRVEVGSGMFRGGGPENHAEARAIRGLEQNGPAKVEGGRMMVVVDQTPCPNCRQRILEYAQSHGIQEIEVHVPTRESLANRDRDVSPKTAAVTSFQGHRPPTEFNTEVWSPSGEVLSSSKARDAGELVAQARRQAEESQEKIHQARALQTAQDDPAARQRHPARPESSAPKTVDQHPTRQPETQRPQPESPAPKTTQSSPAESSAPKTADQHPTRQPNAQRPQAESSAPKTTQPSPAESTAPKTADQHPTRQPNAQRPQAESSAPKTTQPSPAESGAPKNADQHPTRQPETQRPQPESPAPKTTQPSPAESGAPKNADQHPTRQPETQRPQPESPAPKTTQPSPAESGAPKTADQHPTRQPETQRPQPESPAPKTTQPTPAESTAPKTADQHPTRQPNAQRPQAGSSAPKTTQPTPAESSAPKTADQHPETQRPQAESSASKATQPSPTESTAPKTADRHPSQRPETQRPQTESATPKTTQPSPTESSAPTTADQHPTRQPDSQRPQAESSAPKTTQLSPESTVPKTADRHPSQRPETQQPQSESATPKTTQPSPTESSAPKSADQHPTQRPDSQRPQAESSAPKTTQPSPAESTAPKSADQHPSQKPETQRPQAESAPTTTQPSPTESTAPKTADQHPTRQPDSQRPQAESSAPKTTQLSPESTVPKTADRHPSQRPETQRPQTESATPKTTQPSPTESSAPKTADQHPTQQPDSQRPQAESSAPKTTQPSPSESGSPKSSDQRITSPDVDTTRTTAAQSPKASHTRDLGEATPPSPTKSSRTRDLGEEPQAPAAAKASKTRDLGESPQHPRMESPSAEAPAKASKTRDLGEAPKRQPEPTPAKAPDAPRPGERLSSNDRASTADDMKRKSGRDKPSGDKHSAGGIKSTSGGGSSSGSTSGHGDAPVEKRSAVDEMRRKSGRDEGQPPAPAPQGPSKDHRPPKS